MCANPRRISMNKILGASITAFVLLIAGSVNGQQGHEPNAALNEAPSGSGQAGASGFAPGHEAQAPGTGTGQSGKQAQDRDERLVGRSDRDERANSGRSGEDQRMHGDRQ
jgi:hypothetical protein